MCYDIQAKLEAQIKRARRLNQKGVIRKIGKQFGAVHQAMASCFRLCTPKLTDLHQ